MSVKNSQLIIIGLTSTVSLLVNQLSIDNSYFSYVTIVICLLMFVGLWLKAKNESVGSTNTDQSINDADTTDKTTFEALSKLNLLLTHQIKIIEAELNRTTDLVKHAVEGISDSFKSLQNLSADQQHLIATVIENSKSIGDEEGYTLESFVNDSSQTLEDFVGVIW